ncbi:MAG: hypothetical protein QG620_32 [Patescibacteria group bacterium]|nr:hypothetical protein [Patescibacteria group bacterium]
MVKKLIKKQMTNMWKVAVLAAGVVLLAGCGNKGANNQPEARSGPDEKAPVENVQKPGGMISSIKDAMGLGTAMKCTYTDTFDGKTYVSEAYVKGDNYKSANEVDGKKMNSLFDGKVIYSWTEGEKKGTKMEAKCFEDMPKPEEKADSDSAAPIEEKSPEDEFENAMDVKCEPAGGVDFNPPTDVVFEDQCEMMKNLMKNIPANVPGMPENIPQNMNIPNMNIPE